MALKDRDNRSMGGFIDGEGSEGPGRLRADMESWRRSGERSNSDLPPVHGIGGVGLLCVLLLPVVGYLAYNIERVTWNALLHNDARELSVIACASSVIAAIVAVLASRSADGRRQGAFGMGLTAGWSVTSLLFCVASLICSAIPTSPEIYLRIDFLNIIAVAFVSAVVGFGPGLVIGLVCLILRWVDNARYRRRG